MSSSRSSDALRKISQVSVESGLTLEQELQEQEFMWQRTHSLTDTQKVLDDAIRDLEEYIAEDLAELNLQRRYSSNDSAMGGSEAVISPLQLDSTCSEPSTLNRKRQVHDSVDSAFSNYSSPTNSTSEGMHQTDVLSVESDMAVPCNHIRMSSEASNASAVSPSPVPRLESPEPTKSPQSLSRVEASSLPVLDGREGSVEKDTPAIHKSASPLPTQPTHTTNISSSSTTSQTTSRHSSKKSKHKLLSSKVGTYSHQRSPILSSKENHHLCRSSETGLDSHSPDHTPTESTTNITSSPSGLSLDSHWQGTVI